MAWLLTHMWMALVAAAVFALMLGWTVRGILLNGKMRKSIVDKDIALTELAQARDEIESLFAAQRAQRGEGGSVADASARKISDLTAELQKAKGELNALKSSAAKAPATAPTNDKTEMPTIVLPPARVPAEEAESAAAAGDEDDAPSLVWRNRHLEARVQHLEAQLAETSAAPAPAAEADPVAAAAPVMAAMPSVDEEGLSKLKWQADYLKQRVESLEAELAKVPAEAPAAAEDGNEEMARLRWRNRFLEGRLAYFEGGSEEAAAVEVSDAETFIEEEAEPEFDDMLIGAEATLDELDDPHVVVEEDEIVEAVEEAGEEVTDTVEALLVQEEFVEEDDETEEDSFDDVSNDEEESLDEADDADEDVLSDEEYDEEDFVEDDEDEDPSDEIDDDADVEEEDDADEDDEADEFEDDASEDDEDEGDEEDDADESDEEDEVDASEDDAEDEDEDDLEESEDDEDGEYDEEDGEYEADAEDDSEEDDDESDEVDADADEEESDDEADEEELDEDADEYEDEDSEGEADLSYEPTGEVVSERPLSMTGPVEGHPDDLTLIGGIGPKIQILLNELGVWHYDQIADWSPENVAWVDEHLNFNGRIIREGWVEQAAVLVGDAESV